MKINKRIIIWFKNEIVIEHDIEKFTILAEVPGVARENPILHA